MTRAGLRGGGAFAQLRARTGEPPAEASLADRTLRYGIIGTGMTGCEHVQSLALLPGVEIAAITDPHEPSRGRARSALAGRAVEE